MSKLLESKAETLAAIARQPSVPNDWVIVLTPIDPNDDIDDTPVERDGLLSFVHPSGVRMTIWGENVDAVIDLNATLSDVELSGIPDSIVNSATIKLPLRDKSIGVSLREFLDELRRLKLSEAAALRGVTESNTVQNNEHDE